MSRASRRRAGHQRPAPSDRRPQLDDVQAMPEEGVSRCPCGCKYWDGDHCHDCGERWRPDLDTH